MAAILLCLWCAGAACPAFAAGTVEWDRTGSVAVTLKDGDAAVSGAAITLYRVADAANGDGNLRFAFTDAFAAFGGTPEALRDGADMRRLADYAARLEEGGRTLLTDEDGAVCFVGLSMGLYLAVQTGSVPGYSDCSPFLVALPTERDGEWVYDVDAAPKTDVLRLMDITVKKVWNDDGRNRPGSVTVELRRGDTVADTVTLREQNGWSHTWTDRPRSDDWSVKEVSVPKGYTVSYAQSGDVYTVTNTATLIQTGQLKWPVPLLAGAGVLLFAAGCLLRGKGKRNSHA